MQKADLWSCGVLLYALLYGRYPFDAEQKYYVRKIVAAEYVIPQDIPVSSACKHLLRGLLVADPQRRMSIPEVLSQPWFRQDLPHGALDMNHAYLAYHLSLDQVDGMCFMHRSVVHPLCAECAVWCTSVHMQFMVDLQQGAPSPPVPARVETAHSCTCFTQT